MAELIALRAAFGQDEANHGIRRYRVGGDGLVHVPAEAALFLVSKGGFAVAKTTVAQDPGGSLRTPLPDGIQSAAGPSSRVRPDHDITGGCSHCECTHQGDQNSDLLVPAEAGGDVQMHGRATQDLRPGGIREAGPVLIEAIGNATSRGHTLGEGLNGV